MLHTCTAGCSVLTRPPSISGAFVMLEISSTLMLDSRSIRAVPPEANNLFHILKGAHSENFELQYLTLCFVRPFARSKRPRVVPVRIKIVRIEYRPHQSCQRRIGLLSRD